MVRRWWMWVLLLFGLGVLAACQPKEVVKTVVVTQEVVKEKEVVVTQEVEVVKTVEVQSPKSAIVVLGVWGGAEREAFQDAVQPFTEETGIGVAFEGTRDLAAVLTTRVEAGNPPDIAILPNPGQMYELASQGKLVPLDDILDVEQVKKDYGQSWVDLGSYDGKLYGIFYKVAIKSLVWYNPKAFEAKGYTVPTTWDELMALTDQIAQDGATAWCIGLESGAASGWPGTDWIEDIMLRTAGPEIYDKWVRHEIPWTDEAVKKAWEMFGQIVLNEKYVYGGPDAVLNTNFGDAPRPLFDSPPGCYLHRQASFITGFFPEGLKAGEDYNFFVLPPIDPQWGTPALIAGDVVVVFNDTPEVREFVKYLASAEPQTIWAKKGGFISANKQVPLDAYPDDLTRNMAKAIVEAEVARFDGSDLMPAAVGAGAFWQGVLDFVSGQPLDEVLQAIEAAAQDAYK